MISQILEWLLFVVVLFVLLPAIMIFAMSMRNILHHNRQHGLWHKDEPGKSPG